MTNYKDENTYENAKQDMIDKTYEYSQKYNLKVTDGTDVSGYYRRK